MGLLSKATTKREDGEDFPASAFAYVPDAESPSTWKLRLWDSLDQKETAAQVGRALAALGPGGFRGNRVEIPSADIAGVKAKVRAAWKKTHPDASTADVPTVLKHGGDEEASDPLDELLDAYQGFVAMGQVELADLTMECVHDLQALLLGKARDIYRKDGNGEYENPIACLSSAFMGLLMMVGSEDLRTKVLNLIDVASKQLFAGGTTVAPEEPTGGETYVEEGMAGAGMYRQPVRREIRDENGQFCVYSTTGRSFGCYQSRSDATERLAQIERFAASTLAKASLSELLDLHDHAHSIDEVTPAVKEVHDLIEDELEAGFGVARPYRLTAESKLAMTASLDSGLVSKAISEYRYTLGPAYVPNREDAHGEWADDDTLQKAMWDWVRKGDRTIYLQHSDKPAGEMVELLTWPFPIDAELNVPNQGVTKYTFPANTPFLGVVWEPWAFDLVKAGQLRGYSIGGSAKRIEADLPADATL